MLSNHGKADAVTSANKPRNSKTTILKDGKKATVNSTISYKEELASS